MRLYLNAESKKGIGYTPDWLKVSYKEEGQEFDLTLDIQGEIDFEDNGLNCRCKGDLIPWTLCNVETGTEEDLSELSEEESVNRFPVKRIAEILQTGTSFVVGVCPVGDDDAFEEAEDDVLNNCTGSCELYDGENDCEISFEFETELNE